MPFDDEFAIDIEEEFQAPILGRASLVALVICHWSLAMMLNQDEWRMTSDE